MKQLTIGYTLGDQAGIGPEVIEQALQSNRLSDAVRYVLIGERLHFPQGKASLDSAKAAFDHLELAAQALASGDIDGLVTAPVCKETLHDVGFTWPGQTEFFADRLGVTNFAMCLSGPHLTVGLATTHVAVNQVASLLSIPELVRIGKLLANFSRQKGISRPRIALAALNPHAGEHGAFGHEDEQIIRPAVEQLQAQCPWAEFSGPAVPDTVYRDAVEGAYDAILSPFHDQGLIPLKLIDFNDAVNITLGLPRPRVSPDHGTAFNIAGQGKADPSSTIRAFEVATQVAASIKQLH